MGWEGRFLGHAWPGNFPAKHILCAPRHKRVMRDSGGLRWVRMDAGGWMHAQQTQNKAKRVIYGLAWHNCDNHAGGRCLTMRDEGVTWASQNIHGFFGDTKGAASESYAFAHIPHEKRARNNKKKVKTSKFTVVNKVAKNEKTGKQQKNSQKKWEQETKRQSKKNSTKPKLPHVKEQ